MCERTLSRDPREHTNDHLNGIAEHLLARLLQGLVRRLLQEHLGVPCTGVCVRACVCVCVCVCVSVGVWLRRRSIEVVMQMAPLSVVGALAQPRKYAGYMKMRQGSIYLPVISTPVAKRSA